MKLPGRKELVQKLGGIFCLAIFLCLHVSGVLAAKSSQEKSSDIVKLSILARVANRSISNRDLFIYAALLDPKSYQPFEREELTGNRSKLLLQELLVQVLVEEENKIIGVGKVSERSLDQEIEKVQKKFGQSKWSDFKKDFELSDADIRSLVRRNLLVEQTLDLRLRDSLNEVGLQNMTKEQKLESAEKALQNWIQQLRSRYKVQLFNPVRKTL